MQHRSCTYLFYIQYLGLRYSGWQKQKGIKTVQGTVERGIRFSLGHEDFNVLAASRTDAGVSCNRGAFELFLKHPITIAEFIPLLNNNLPSDIRILEGKDVPLEFNIIQDVALKTYTYHFAFGEKFHPFLAGNLAYFPGFPDVRLMQEAAAVFVGMHCFRRFCAADKISDNYFREVVSCNVTRHPLAGTGFYPEQTYIFQIKGKGFLKYQIRILVAALVDLGSGKLTLENIKTALTEEDGSQLSIAAPANGLVLENIEFVEFN